MRKGYTIREVYELHCGMVYSLSLNYLQNKEDAEEITQDVFVKAYQKIHQFKEEASIKTWLYRITINCCLDFIKAKNRNKRSFLRNAKEIDKVVVPTFEHPGVLLENRERAAILLACINELADPQKTAFLLSKVDGMKQEEISKIMDKSIASVESLIFRAKQNLKKIIASKWKDARKE